MKKLIFLLTTFFTYTILSAQVVTTEPAFLTEGYTGTVKIIFDPSQGTGGMIGATDCYAHTGVSTSDGKKWQCTGTWRDNTAAAEKYKMTQEGTKWVLTIPNMYTFYDCAAVSGKRFSELCFVFHDGPLGEKEGKETGGKDIFIPIYEAGLNVKFDAPASNQLVATGGVVNFVATASDDANMTLYINNQSESTASGTSLTYTKTFSSAGDYTCVIEAKKNEKSIRDTIYVCVPSTAAYGARPANSIEGINYGTDHTKVTLVMYAKDRSNVMPDNVFLLGDFNQWAYNNSYQLKKDGTTGYWWITVDNLTQGKEYAFQYAVKIGNEVIQISDAYTEKVLDPWEDSYISSSVYPGLSYPDGGDGLVSVFQTNKPKYNWSEATLNFTKPDKNNLVIYEMWIYDFSPVRTIKAATERLDYLQSLGVNAIELMPVPEFDGNISWGYNPNHFFAPDKAYGTPDDYKKFIDECHKRGIAVILDMAFNHATGNHPFAKLYWNGVDNVKANNPWFNETPPHDHSVNQDFDHGFTGTKEHFKRVLQYWIEEYKVDGYRMDLSKGLCGQNCENDRVGNVFDYYNAAKANGNDNIIFILEHWTDREEEQNYVDYGMLCWRNTNHAYCQTAMGWLMEGDDFGSANERGWVSYCESHDEERCFFKAKAHGNGNIATDSIARFNRVPLNMIMNVLLQGPQMIWQFGELGYDFEMGEDGVQMQPKPVPEALGWYKDPYRMDMYKKVSQAVQLRTRLIPGLFVNGATNDASMGSGYWVRYVTWSGFGETKVHVVGNFAVSNMENGGVATTTLPDGTWYDYLNNNAVVQGGREISMQPGEVKILVNKNTIVAPDIPTSFDFPLPVSNNEVKEKVNCIVFPTVTDGYVWIESEEPVKKVQVINLRGGLVKSAGSVTELNMSDLQQGMYLLIVTFEKQQMAFKIIKK